VQAFACLTYLSEYIVPTFDALMQVRPETRLLRATSPAFQPVKARSTKTGSMSSRWYKPTLTMRPITTHINLLVAGASRSGKAAFIEAFADGLGAQIATTAHQEVNTSPKKAKNPTTPIRGGSSSDTKGGSEGLFPSAPPAAASGAMTAASVSDPVTAFELDPNSWATRLQPLVVPEAGRELLYTLQVSGGNYQSCCSTAQYLISSH
jgi:hypothetical protein